jgi:hypothetical protein
MPVALTHTGWTGRESRIRSYYPIAALAQMLTDQAIFTKARYSFRSRTPGPPPFSSMNCTPAASRAARSFFKVLA